MEKELNRNLSYDTIGSSNDEILPLKLILRIDLHVLPLIIIIYLTSFLDRINFGNALIYGMPQELGMSQNQVSTAIALLFVTYVSCEIPAAIVMKKVKPQFFLPTCAVLFGLLMTLHGIVKNYASLVVLRVLGGIFEAGVYPASFYLMSMWYTRREAQKRFSLFTAGCSLAGAFGALIATGIGYMDGVGGYKAWRWIFILEGLFTIVVGIIAFFTVSDFPEHAKWLSEDERKIVVQHLAKDQGSSGVEKNVSFKELILVLKDWKILLSAPLYFGVSLSVYGLGYFIPTIISTYGYGAIQAQLHSVIPWAAALGWALGTAYLSDRYQIRFPFLLLSLILSVVGNLMLFTIHTNQSAQFAGLFLYLMGCGGAVPVLICWITMNLRGHKERVIGIPYMVGIGSASGIVGAFAFQEPPEYRLGYSLGLGFLLLSLAISIVYLVGYTMSNRKREREERYML